MVTIKTPRSSLRELISEASAGPRGPTSPQGREFAYRQKGAIAGLKEQHSGLMGGDRGGGAVALVEGDQLGGQGILCSTVGRHDPQETTKREGVSSFNPFLPRLGVSYQVPIYLLFSFLSHCPTVLRCPHSSVLPLGSTSSTFNSTEPSG